MLHNIRTFLASYRNKKDFTLREHEFNKVYLEMVSSISKLSRAQRTKVAALIVRDGNILSYGFNGTPEGMNNSCEFHDGDKLVTCRDVLHAESNAISKVARSHYSIEDSDIYVSISPCIECAKLIVQNKIRRVFFNDVYRDTMGLSYLIAAGVECYSYSTDGAYRGKDKALELHFGSLEYDDERLH